MSAKQIARLILAIILVLVAAYVAKYFITGGHHEVTLAPGKPLTSVVSQALGGTDTNNQTLLGTQDFAIQNPVYLNNRTWLILRVAPAKHNFDPTLLVFKKVNGAWQCVLGPSSEFSTTVKISLPKSVGAYLEKQGVLVE